MNYIEPIKTDWGKMLDQLRMAGCSEYKVAQILGKKWDTVMNWREHEPRHSDGEALKKLHAKFVLTNSSTAIGWA